MKRFIIIILSFMLLVSCARKKEYHYTNFLFGAPCDIKFYFIDDVRAKEIIDVIDLELTRLDSLLNYFSDKSLVSELNRNLRVKAPGDIIYLFSLCDSVSRLTNGLFDISIAPLVEGWGFYEGKKRVPDSFEIERLKGLVNFRKIQIKDDSIIIEKGMKIDLAGIAQGYAADRVGMILRQRSVRSAIINIGGEILGIGESPRGRPWRVGIKNPRGKGIIETIELKDSAVSTSGDYEKFFIIDHKRYCHIINPKTGFPAQDFASVTICAKSAGFADALATAVSIMGRERAIKFLDSLKIHSIIYYYDEKDQKLHRLEVK